MSPPNYQLPPIDREPTVQAEMAVGNPIYQHYISCEKGHTSSHNRQ